MEKNNKRFDDYLFQLELEKQIRWEKERKR